LSQSVSLHSTVTGQGPALILLHGLFGMGQNLAMIARALEDQFQVHSLDLRNHGRSEHADSMSFTDMATDVLNYMDQHSIEQSCLLGHSLGGKVAMQVALLAPQRILRLVVADIAPVAYSGHHDEVFAGIGAVQLSQIVSRKDAEAMLAPHISELGIRQFILKNIYRNEQGQFDWLMNVAGLKRCYGQIREAVSGGIYEGPVLFIKGELSSYIQEKHQDLISALFPHAQLKIIQGASHWLHAEEPAQFNRLARAFLLGE
jgi:esterase